MLVHSDSSGIASWMDIKSEWRSGTAGGGIDGATWRDNPQFILSNLQVGEECTLSLKLTDHRDNNPGVGFALIKGCGGMLKLTVTTLY